MKRVILTEAQLINLIGEEINLLNGPIGKKMIIPIVKKMITGDSDSEFPELPAEYLRNLRNKLGDLKNIKINGPILNGPEEPPRAPSRGNEGNRAEIPLKLPDMIFQRPTETPKQEPAERPIKLPDMGNLEPPKAPSRGRSGSETEKLAPIPLPTQPNEPASRDEQPRKGNTPKQDKKPSKRRGLLDEWLDCVSRMGKWYEQNVHTYLGTLVKPRASRKAYRCPLINGVVYDDCSSFIKACLQLFGVSEIKEMGITTTTMQPGSSFDRLLLASGFIRLEFGKTELEPGDIMCGGPRTHTEIYAGNGKSYAWGNIHDGINGHKGMPCPMSSRANKWIWRIKEDNV